MEPVTNIKLSDTLKSHYDKLFQDGFLVNLSISKWGMGAQLNQADLGIQKAVPKIFKLGKKMLIDEKHFNAFVGYEGRARRYLYKNSYPFHISEAHFIPKKKLLTVLAELDKFKAEYKAAADAFVENYPTYKEAMLAEYPEHADALRPLYPRQTELRAKFDFQVMTFELAMPRELAAVDVQALIARDEAKDEVKKKLEEQLADQHKTAMAQLEKFTENAAQSLRQQIGGVCTTLIDKIKRKEIISKTNIDTIKGEIENFRSLNFLDDKVVQAEIDKLETLVNGNHNFKTDDATIMELNDALAGVLKTAASTSDISQLTGKYFRSIKL